MSDKTPSGEDRAGYLEALENYVYEIDRLALDIDNAPGELAEKLVGFMSKQGELWDQLGDRVHALDEIAVVITDTYGYTEAQVEQDLHRLAKEKAAVSFLALFGSLE